jgi:hypothetical protein
MVSFIYILARILALIDAKIGKYKIIWKRF